MLTCRTFSTMGTALRWFNDIGVIIHDIPVYNYQESDEFPQTLLPENALSAFISYVMEDASFDPSMPTEVSFTALLVVNPELLLSSGYRTLNCAPGLTEGANFTINQIDMESKQIQEGATLPLLWWVCGGEGWVSVMCVQGICLLFSWLYMQFQVSQEALIFVWCMRAHPICLDNSQCKSRYQ